MSYTEVITVQQLLEEELDGVKTLKQEYDAEIKQLNWSDYQAQTLKKEVDKLDHVIEYLQDRIAGRYANEN